MKGRPLTADQRAGIVAGTARNEDAGTIAAGLKISRRSVERYQVGLGLREKAKRVPPTGWQEHAIRLLDDGASIAETARTVGVHKRTIAHHFPGRAWTNAQSREYALLCRHHGEAPQ